MRILDLAARPGRRIDAHGSRGFTITALGLTADAHLVAVTLAPGGVIGRHPAAGRQMLVVLTGDATVSGGSDGSGEAVTVGPGQAAVWEPHEPHETRTSGGLTALVVEGELELGTPGHHVDPGDV
ncbi:MAG: cupin domain-containing protein [Nocardioides sp.]|nr:cupin domain-containing protein [Nocardioides sp.]